MASLAYIPHRADLAEKFRQTFWNDDRLVDYLERWAMETPDRIALSVPGGAALTY